MTRGSAKTARRITPSSSTGTLGEPRTTARRKAGSERGPLSGPTVSARTTRLTPSWVKSRIAWARAASSASVVEEVNATSRPTTAAPLRCRARRSLARYSRDRGWRRPSDSKAASSMATMTTSEANR